MKIGNIQFNRPAVIIITAIFALICSVWIARVKVSSQDIQTIKNTKMSEKPKEKKDNNNDDGIQEYIDILTTTRENVTSSRKVDAIKRLGNANKKRAIPVLIKYLDYEDPSLRRSENSIDITDRDDIFPTKCFPAVGSLVQFGNEALPYLVRVLEEESLDSMRSKNASITIQFIFIRGNMMEGVLYLEKAASESKIPNGSERLLAAAQEMRKLLSNVQK